MAYVADAAVMEQQKESRKILQRLNFADRSDFEQIAAIVKELLGKSEEHSSTRPFTAITASTSRLGKTFSPTTTAPSSTWRR